MTTNVPKCVLTILIQVQCLLFKDGMKPGRNLEWHDNECAQVCFNHSDPSAMSTIQRWDEARKKHVNIKFPNTIKEYNESMGGVDLADMLISVYRTHFKTKRWYLKILLHCVDISKINA